MSNILDKTFTLRQVWRWTRRAIYVAIPVYIVAIFLHAWNMKIGGVSLNDSPFKDRIPAQCEGYAQKSLRTPANRTTADELLLRGRIRRYSLANLIGSSSPLFSCLGYAVLGGAHDRTPGDANFIEQYVDAQGDPFITVRVEYNKPYTGQ
jgi:hypothetical protein